METATSILLTQIPIAIAILIGAYELRLIRKEIVLLIEKLKKSK